MAVVVATMGTTKKSMVFIRKTFIKIPCWDMVIWDPHQVAFRCHLVIGHPLHTVVECPQLVIVKEECPIQCCPFQVVRAVARYRFHEFLFLIFAIFLHFTNFLFVFHICYLFFQFFRYSNGFHRPIHTNHIRGLVPPSTPHCLCNTSLRPPIIL